MSEILKKFIPTLRLGEIVVFDNLAIVPLMSETNSSPEYLTLQEVLGQGLLIVSELGAGGSVPELKVVNKAELPVLLLDGEELVGAKQNRVLNTTILLKEKSETVIPVSCTEHGRWSAGAHGMSMGHSEFIHSPRTRLSKMDSVNYMLNNSHEFRSSQTRVWDEVAERSREAGVHSPTGAMNDVVVEKGADLDDYCKNFHPLPDQRGLLAFVNGRISGLDWISLKPAFDKLHGKLIKSYALDALLLRREEKAEPSLEAAQKYCRVKFVDLKEFDSIGYGVDVRIQQPGLVGSALIYRDCVIHCAMFPISDAEAIGPMSSSHRRRAFRI